jgi:hypothetical protein
MKCETAEGGETLNFIMCRTVECETAEGGETFYGSTGIICYYST